MKPDARRRIYQTKVSTTPSYWSANRYQSLMDDCRWASILPNAQRMACLGGRIRRTKLIRADTNHGGHNEQHTDEQ